MMKNSGALLMNEAGGGEGASARYWQEQITSAVKVRGDWIRKSKDVIKRYKDDRGLSGDEAWRSSKFNILWANIETLKPALYSATPVPVVVRRFKDADPVARAAAEILQRCLAYCIESYDFDHVIRQNILDYLLTGLTTAWVRYEPEFTQEPVVDPATGQPATDEKGQPVVQDALSYENVPTDYVHWSDVLFSKSRVWKEVWWAARRVFMDREAGLKRFGDRFRDVPLDYCDTATDEYQGSMDSLSDKVDRKATVWEIWDKKRRKVVWMHPSFQEILDERDPPIQFRDFFPCPRPLLGTNANDSLIPVPDYVEYKDQADELDDLTGRINLLTNALRVAGVYDAGAGNLEQLLDGDMSNKLIPVENWAAFGQSGGMKGSIEFLPLQQVVEALIQLYNARDRVKQDLYEITGLSDIIRGASQAQETATAQRIKAQWGSIRLRDKQADVQRYVRDLIRLKAEVIAELFQPETLMQMSGLQLPSRQDEMLKYQQAMQQHQMMAQQAQMQGQGQQLPPPPQEPQGPFMEDVIDLLREDKLRSYRIDIETDSTIAADEAQEKQDRAELIQSFMGLLQNGAPLLAQAPELGPVLKDIMLFGVRSFRVGSGMEESIERSMDQLGQRLAQPPPPPPDPNQAKMAEVEANTKLKQQEMAGNFQVKREQMAGDMALEREKLIMQEARAVNPFMAGGR